MKRILQFAMNKTSIFLLLTFFLISFQGLAQELTEMKEVVATHDEVMAKMPELVKLINQLQPKVDTTKKGQKYQLAIDDLKASNKSMMTWMQGFGERFTAEEMMKDAPLTSQKKKWLAEEKVKLKALDQEVTKSMRKATELLKG